MGKSKSKGLNSIQVEMNTTKVYKNQVTFFGLNGKELKGDKKVSVFGHFLKVEKYSKNRKNGEKVLNTYFYKIQNGKKQPKERWKNPIKPSYGKLSPYSQNLCCEYNSTTSLNEIWSDMSYQNPIAKAYLPVMVVWHKSKGQVALLNPNTLQLSFFFASGLLNINQDMNQGYRHISPKLHLSESDLKEYGRSYLREIHVQLSAIRFGMMGSYSQAYNYERVYLMNLRNKKILLKNTETNPVDQYHSPKPAEGSFQWYKERKNYREQRSQSNKVFTDIFLRAKKQNNNKGISSGELAMSRHLKTGLTREHFQKGYIVSLYKWRNTLVKSTLERFQEDFLFEDTTFYRDLKEIFIDSLPENIERMQNLKEMIHELEYIQKCKDELGYTARNLNYLKIVKTPQPLQKDKTFNWKSMDLENSPEIAIFKNSENRIFFHIYFRMIYQYKVRNKKSGVPTRQNLFAMTFEMVEPHQSESPNPKFRFTSLKQLFSKEYLVGSFNTMGINFRLEIIYPNLIRLVLLKSSGTEYLFFMVQDDQSYIGYSDNMSDSKSHFYNSLFEYYDARTKKLTLFNENKEGTEIVKTVVAFN